MEQYAEIIHQKRATPDYPYNVHIITNGYYCGVGRFCKTLEEAERYIVEKFPGIIRIKVINGFE